MSGTYQVLALLSTREDRAALKGILERSKWTCHLAESMQEAFAVLREQPIEVVISDSRLPDGYDWIDLLRFIEANGSSQPLIVTDRLADERLWAEVLNRGAYDLLMKPLDNHEVIYVLNQAWLGAPKMSNAR